MLDLMGALRSYGGRRTMYSLHKNIQSFTGAFGGWWQRERGHKPGIMFETRQLRRQYERRWCRQERTKIVNSRDKRYPKMQRDFRYRWCWRMVLALRKTEQSVQLAKGVVEHAG